MAEIKIGQIVELINNNSMAASKGATAVVTGIVPWFRVKWLTKARGQMDGDYARSYFKPISTKGQQLVFDFMKE